MRVYNGSKSKNRLLQMEIAEAKQVGHRVAKKVSARILRVRDRREAKADAEQAASDTDPVVSPDTEPFYYDDLR